MPHHHPQHTGCPIRSPPKLKILRHTRDKFSSIAIQGFWVYPCTTLLGLEEENSAVSEVEVDEVLGFYAEQSETGGWQNKVRTVAYHASRNCQSCGQQCNARSGPCGHRTVRRLISNSFFLHRGAARVRYLTVRLMCWAISFSIVNFPMASCATPPDV
jgi:hypothetical protein